MTTTVNKRNLSEMPQYQYKLNENHKGSDFASLQGIRLTKNWKTFDSFKHELKKLIKTYNNSEGVVDFRVLNPFDEKIVEQTDLDYDKDRIIYSRKILSTFDRKKIEKISLDWLINPVKKRNEFLIDLIVKEQTIYEEYIKKQNIEGKDEEDIAFDNTNDDDKDINEDDKEYYPEVDIETENKDFNFTKSSLFKSLKREK